MYKILVALAVAVLVAGPSSASEKTDVMAPLHQFVDGFNKGDTKTALAACAEQTSIIDEFPPHEWHGAGACSTWANDFDADVKKNGITDGIVTLGNPRHVDVTADRAYVVVPANYTFKKKGKLVKETGSMLTVALQKDAVVGALPDGRGRSTERRLPVVASVCNPGCRAVHLYASAARQPAAADGCAAAAA